MEALGIAAVSGLLVSNHEAKLEEKTAALLSEEKTEIQLLTDVKTLRDTIISTIRIEYSKIQSQK